MAGNVTQIGKIAEMKNFSLEALLLSLDSDQKRQLARFGVSPSRRSDWLHGARTPTAAQLKTLAIITHQDPTPMLDWLTEQEATPEQLALFRGPLARAAAAMAVVILAGVQNHADAASMRVAALFADVNVPQIMRSSQ